MKQPLQKQWKHNFILRRWSTVPIVLESHIFFFQWNSCFVVKSFEAVDLFSAASAEITREGLADGWPSSLFLSFVCTPINRRRMYKVALETFPWHKTARNKPLLVFGECTLTWFPHKEKGDTFQVQLVLIVLHEEHTIKCHVSSQFIKQVQYVI